MVIKFTFSTKNFNAEIKESLGVSPAQIMFRNAIDLDRGIILPHSNSITRETAL